VAETQQSATMEKQLLSIPQRLYFDRNVHPTVGI